MRDFVQIKRLPYARADLVRRRAEGKAPCQWCGSAGKYEYGYDYDSGRTTWASGTFCCVDCFRTYHDIDPKEQ